MTATSTGRQAEDRASEYLMQKGYKILDQNWKTRWCEIDIVAKKANIIYFAEVKYRKTNSFGGGLDYITPKKIEQMKLAARFWCSEVGWSGDYRLSAIEVSGQEFEVTNFIKSI